MKDIILIALVLFSLQQSITAVNCSTTHFLYTNIYTLGKQDELNKTFEKIQEKITSLNDVVYQASELYTYTISKVNPSFYYRDSKQKATIRGESAVIIDGGFLEVDFTFEW